MTLLKCHFDPIHIYRINYRRAYRSLISDPQPPKGGQKLKKGTFAKKPPKKSEKQAKKTKKEKEKQKRREKNKKISAPAEFGVWLFPFSEFNTKKP